MKSLSVQNSLILIISLVCTAQMPAESSKYNYVENIKELLNKESGQYIIKINIQKGVIYEKKGEEIKEQTEVYNCEKCEGYGKVFLTKTGEEYSVQKFVNEKEIEGRWPIIKSQRTILGKKFLVNKEWITLSHSVTNPKYAEKVNGKYIGTY